MRPDPAPVAAAGEDDTVAAALAQLARWRAQGAERIDRAGFQRIVALATRAQAYRGATRQRLDARLAELLAAQAATLARAGLDVAADVGDAAVGADPTAGSPTATGARVGLDAGSDSGPIATLKALHAVLGEHQAGFGGEALARRAAYPDLPALAQFRQLWSSLRTESQLRLSLQPLPADAGPLNSAVLVQRAIARMRALSPGYLQHFLAYVDALAWMERLQGERALPAPESARAAPAKKPATRSRSKRRAE